ncbi:hypothetical protein PV10_00778 [Exophiala mesophila]|uniref:Xylanolytic transcriptional activator regulatory domain-containing protein n=1 Tax=Exophiala mesophila TaxID=212818 RepID=A0A0D2ADK2_EXOME|nr:uncharacterized protein PV10_00778 [Exophiala mesophila]KIV96968.1 hypothetical protein PV10_00778 [Exophiala mesophila]
MSLPTLEFLPSQPVIHREPLPIENIPSSWPLLGSDRGRVDGLHAIQDLSHMINTTSADVTSEAHNVGLTSVFLDGCLHMFFTRFVPSFPVVHAPTFVFKEWTHPLLLNAIALGSLFMGKSDYVAKGEVLWRLAHTAVATSWPSLIKHRGPRDSCCGVQLVLTALLGQVYAMMSKNVVLRQTAQVFHSLGFYWARETGMYDFSWQDWSDIQEPSQVSELNDESWRRWAARETQLRALLGHYILDGQISEYSGSPTCQRHTTHSLPIPSPDSVFEASTATQWFAAQREQTGEHTHFLGYFSSLFSPNFHLRHMGVSLTGFTASVLLEGLKSIVSDKPKIEVNAVGLPSQPEIARALGHLYGCIVQSTALNSVVKQAILLRWHTIGIDAAVKSGWLCQNLCRYHNLEQNIFNGAKGPAIELLSWSRSSLARLALLHATCIHDILRDLPMTRTQSVHVPSAAFSAGVVYCAFMTTGTSNIRVPDVLHWESLLLVDHDGPLPVTNADLDRGARLFLRDTPTTQGLNTNIVYDLNLFCNTLQNLEQVWGFAGIMYSTLDRLALLSTQA